jgi:hypothetical protein
MDDRPQLQVNRAFRSGARPNCMASGRWNG